MLTDANKNPRKDSVEGACDDVQVFRLKSVPFFFPTKDVLNTKEPGIFTCVKIDNSSDFREVTKN